MNSPDNSTYLLRNDEDEARVRQYKIAKKSETKDIKHRYECKICSFKAGSTGNIRKHLLKSHGHIENKMKPHECRVCGFTCGMFVKMAKHMDEKHTIDIYPRCDLCQLKCANKSEVRKHTDYVHLNIKIKCELCNYKAIRKSGLKKHTLVQHKGLRFKCILCHFECISQKGLKYHTRMIHLKVMCILCNNICVGEKKLSEHTIEVHEGKMVNCPDCEFRSFVKKEMEMHIRNAHPKPKIKVLQQTHECPNCKYTSKFLSIINRHIQTHCKEFLYCDKCNYKTQRNNNMKMHKVLNHTLNDRFDKFASNLGNSHKILLKKHNLSLRSELSFRCTLCQFRITSLQELKEHQRNCIKKLLNRN